MTDQKLHNKLEIFTIFFFILQFLNSKLLMIIRISIEFYWLASLLVTEKHNLAKMSQK